MDGEGCGQKRWHGHALLGRERREKAREFETPMKGRERISHF